MALRGPIPIKDMPAGCNDPIKAPTWLSTPQRRIFRQLIAEALDAKLGLSHLDAHAFAVTAVSMDEYIRRPTAQTRRDLIQLLRDLGGTPMARARLGTKADTGKPSRMAQLLKLPAKSV